MLSFLLLNLSMSAQILIDGFATIEMKKSFVPLNEITEKSQLNSLYRYTLGPLLLKCFEDTFGKKQNSKSYSLII